MAKKKTTVSQSRTMWVKKGTTLASGQVVKKGYVAQYGKPEKKVSATVKLTGGGTRTYKEGRAVKKPAAIGGGVTPAQIRQRLNNPANTADNKGPKSYVGKSGTRTSSYQTGEGMTARPKKPQAPRTFAGSSVASKKKPVSKPSTRSGKNWWEQGGGGVAGLDLGAKTQFSWDRQGGFKWGANWKWNGKKWVKG